MDPDSQHCAKKNYLNKSDSQVQKEHEENYRGLSNEAYYRSIKVFTKDSVLKRLNKRRFSSATRGVKIWILDLQS